MANPTRLWLCLKHVGPRFHERGRDLLLRTVPVDEALFAGVYVVIDQKALPSFPGRDPGPVGADVDAIEREVREQVRRARLFWGDEERPVGLMLNLEQWNVFSRARSQRRRELEESSAIDIYWRSLWAAREEWPDAAGHTIWGRISSGIEFTPAQRKLFEAFSPLTPAIYTNEAVAARTDLARGLRDEPSMFDWLDFRLRGALEVSPRQRILPCARVRGFGWAGRFAHEPISPANIDTMARWAHVRDWPALVLWDFIFEDHEHELLLARLNDWYDAIRAAAGMPARPKRLPMLGELYPQQMFDQLGEFKDWTLRLRERGR